MSPYLDDDIKIAKKRNSVQRSDSAISFDSAVTPKSVTRIRAATMMKQTKVDKFASRNQPQKTSIFFNESRKNSVGGKTNLH